MKFEKILFHTRFRELAFNSLETILELKPAGLKTIVLAHVVPVEEVSFVPYGGYLKEAETEIRQKARLTFEDWSAAITARGIDVEVRIEVGVPNSEILSIAEQEAVDLIVVGRKKRTLLEKIYVGSHVLDILRRSNVPVLMNKYMVEFESEGERLARENTQIFRRPMLATDWSAPSNHALEAIIAFKGVLETALVTHVIDAKVAKGVDAQRRRELEDKSEQRLAAYCQKLRGNGLSAESHLSAGNTAAEIIRMSREYKASMIVMGRTGKDWIEEYWLGGISHRVAEMSELPVLLIP